MGCAAAATLLLAGAVQARPQYLSAFRSTYGSKIQVNCNVCHVDGTPKSQRNAFGKAVGTAIGQANCQDAARIAAGLKEAVGQMSLVKGKTFGQLLDEGKLPTTVEAPPPMPEAKPKPKLPDPFDQLELDEDQTKKAAEILVRLRSKEESLRKRLGLAKSTKLKRSLEEGIAELDQDRTAEIGQLLTDEQRGKLDEIAEQKMDGVPIGLGFFRSYTIEDYFRPADALATTGRPRRAATPADTPGKPDGIKFQVANRSGKSYVNGKITITLLNAAGEPVGSAATTVENIDDGQTQEVKVVLRGEYSRLSIVFEGGKIRE